MSTPTATCLHSLRLTTSDPRLYLPPLLSPLPRHIARTHDSLSDEELSSVSTHLPEIDPASLALHQALHRGQPIDSHYAASKDSNGFDWADLSLEQNVEREWYCVVFGSRRNEERESLCSYRAEREAQQQAVKSGGLVVYYLGVPDATSLSLATYRSRCQCNTRLDLATHRYKRLMRHDLDYIHAKRGFPVVENRWLDGGSSIRQDI